MRRGSKKLGLFICYRRSEGGGYAGLLYGELEERFKRRARLFMDVTSVEYGADFVEKIEREIKASDFVIVIIDGRWLEARDGKRRLDDPKDFVRFEIETAFKYGVGVMPVLVQGAKMPSEGELPETVKRLAKLNAFELSDSRREYDLDRLAEALGWRKRNSLTWALTVAGLIAAALALLAVLRFWPSARGTAQANSNSPSVSASEAREAPSATPGVAPPTPGVNSNRTEAAPAPPAGAVPVPPLDRPYVIGNIIGTGQPMLREVSLLDAQGEIVYGQSGPALGGEGLNKLVADYRNMPAAKFSAEFRRYLPRLAASDDSLARDREFTTLLKQVAAQDPIMSSLINKLFRDEWWAIALIKSDSSGLKTPLGRAVIYETALQSGFASVDTFKRKTDKDCNGSPASGVDEKLWVSTFLKNRRDWVTAHVGSEGLRNSIIHHRVGELQKLIDADNWELKAPITIRHYTITD